MGGNLSGSAEGGRGALAGRCFGFCPGFWPCKRRENDERERRSSKLAHERHPVCMNLSGSKIHSDPYHRRHLKCLNLHQPPDSEAGCGELRLSGSKGLNSFSLPAWSHEGNPGG